MATADETVARVMAAANRYAGRLAPTLTARRVKPSTGVQDARAALETEVRALVGQRDRAVADLTELLAVGKRWIDTPYGAANEIVIDAELRDTIEAVEQRYAALTEAIRDDAPSVVDSPAASS